MNVNTKLKDQASGSEIDKDSGTATNGLPEDIRILGKIMSAEEIMDIPGLQHRTLDHSTKWPRQWAWMFRLGLYLFDFLAIYASFEFARWVAGLPFNADQWMPGAWTVLFVCLILPFFPSSDLYSYHIIFSQKQHSSSLLRGLGWGCITTGMVVLQFLSPTLWQYFPIGTTLSGLACLGVLFWFVKNFKDSMHKLFMAVGISLIAVGLIHLIHDGNVSLLTNRLWFWAVGMAMAALTLNAGRYLIIEKLYNGRLMQLFRRQVAIVGTNKEAEEIASHIIENNAPFWIAGTIGCEGPLNAPVPKDCLGDIIEIQFIAKEHRLSDIIVTDEKLDKRTLISLLDFAISKGITVWFPPRILPIIDEKIYIEHFCGIPMIRMCQQKGMVLYNHFKLGIDAVLALLLTLILSPLLITIAIAIKINSKGPIFYKADAVGKNGLPFKMFKFRSMRVNNDNEIHKEFVTKLIKGEISKEEGDSQPLKLTNDPRITFTGNLLRKYSLDELPQLINVVLGQMSLIGPRPCLPYEFEVYQDWYKKRAAIRPGISGLWQVTGRSEVDFEEMVLLDLYYVYNRNIWLDMNILIDTVFVVINKKGAY